MTFDSYEGDTAQLEAHERRIKRCTSCQAKIIWFKTAAGNNMPVDADTVEPGDNVEELDLSRHKSHFASCPNSAKHRKPRGKE
jgi:hypothetical protein